MTQEEIVSEIKKYEDALEEWSDEALQKKHGDEHPADAYLLSHAKHRMRAFYQHQIDCFKTHLTPKKRLST